MIEQNFIHGIIFEGVWKSLQIVNNIRLTFFKHVDMDKAQTSGFGFQECVAIAGKNRTLKKHCGTTYKAIAYYCAEVQKQLGMKNVPTIGSATSGATGMEASP